MCNLFSMEIVTLDLEGVLVPEIWIAFAEKTGIPELRRTTRDEPDYHKLMAYRMEILKEHGLHLDDIQSVIATIKPLDGAAAFIAELRELTQVIILSDTFSEFALPLMRQLGYPTIFCNSLVVGKDGTIEDVKMRCENGKLRAVESLQGIGFRVFASGDSYNDLAMIHQADGGCLFRAPEKILEEEKDLKLVTEYSDLLSEIKAFIMADSRRLGFIISIAMLLIGMTIGFILLSLAYSGPVWVKAIVALVYFIIVILVIWGSKRYIALLKESEKH